MSEEREPGQHPKIHEQAETHVAGEDDTNEDADERVEILQPSGEPAPRPEEEADLL